MKTKYFFLAAIGALTLASCSNDEFVGDTSPTTLGQEGDGSIQFTYTVPNATRADIYGTEAAKLLGYNFYVMGTKGDEGAKSPSPNVVFDNYLVHWGANTAGTTESNTANWEYVGVVPGTDPTANYDKLGSYSASSGQTIKYWDYSAAQYDFFAFSTGDNAAAKDNTTPSTGTVGVTTMKHGTGLEDSKVAYTLYIPSVAELKETYITDIKEVKKGTAYGKEVQLQFKNIGSKVRVALYETVPGYSVANVKFYQVDGTNTDLSSATKYDDAYLISTNANSFPTKGDIQVYFPNVGTGSNSNPNKNKAAANVVNVTGTYTYQNFGALDNFATKEFAEPDDDGATPTPTAYHFIGRTLPNATFAGTEAAKYYETVFPVSSSYPLTLRVDYTLVSTDGSGEAIKVYGAKAVVPANYTKWLPNYAYTYIFKISDNTNGWTSTVTTDPAGLFPITFDAVVTEATDATGEQTTITTVAAPSITTYQQGHLYKPADEYDNDVDKLVYAQVMDNSGTPAKPVGSDACTLLPDLSDANSLLFSVSAAATEAEVMDALQNNIDGFGTYPIEGRNGLTLTKDALHITNGVTTIVSGVNNNDIVLTKATDGHVASINTHALLEGTYAYVYNYQVKSGDKNVYQQIVKTAGQAIGVSGKTRYSSITGTDLGTWDDIATNPSSTHYSTAGAPEADYLYFSITKNGTGTTTYSFVSVEGKETIPAGLLKVPADGAPMTTGVNGNTVAVAGTFYFEKYINNDGLYAVKVIKVED